IAHDGMIYVGVNDAFWAVGADGQKHWIRGEMQGAVDAAPVALADDSVCVISRHGALVGFGSGPDFPMRWDFYLSGYGVACPAVSPSREIYVSDRGKYLSAFGIAAPLAHSPWPKFRGNARNTGNARDNLY